MCRIPLVCVISFGLSNIKEEMPRVNFKARVLAREIEILHDAEKIAAIINTVGLLLCFFAQAEYDAYRIAATVVLALGTVAAYVALIDYSKKTYVQLNHTVKNKSDMDLKF